MAGFSLQPPLVARNGGGLVVLGIARISTLHQDERSLDDQEALYRRWLDEHTSLSYTLTMIASQGSGECLDRQESVRAQELVETRTLDLVLTEDLARIFRRVHAHLFCEHCEDHETRLIAINDHVDTLREDWRMHSFFAVFKHESGNKDTASRIRRSLRNRFTNGGVFQAPIFGYIKPPGARSDTDVYKDPAAEPIYEEWWSRLEGGATYAEVADWLNANGILPRTGSRSKRWTGRLVRQITFNTILKGVRQRNNKISKRVNSTGRRKSVNAPPEELLERHCPHLAFVDPARYDRLIRTLKAKNAKYTVGKDGKGDPRRNRPKKRTIWPGQHIYCGVCGRMFVYGGHGQKDHLMCDGARQYKCWNGITVDGPLAARKMSAAIIGEIEALPKFDSAFLDLVRTEHDGNLASRDERLTALTRKKAQTDREIANLLEFIREGGRTRHVRDDLERVEAEMDALVKQVQAIEREPTSIAALPSLDELKQLGREAMARQAGEPYEFGRAMRELIPRIVVSPYQLCDGVKIVLRANFSLSLAPLLGPNHRPEGLDQVLRRELVVDLYDPPDREVFREQVIALKAKRTEKQIADQLGITYTKVQRAVALNRLMGAMGLGDPYVLVAAPPDGVGKLRRHLHPRYRFDPLPNREDV